MSMRPPSLAREAIERFYALRRTWPRTPRTLPSMEQLSPRQCLSISYHHWLTRQREYLTQQQALARLLLPPRSSGPPAG